MIPKIEMFELFKKTLPLIRRECLEDYFKEFTKNVENDGDLLLFQNIYKNHIFYKRIGSKNIGRENGVDHNT